MSGSTEKQKMGFNASWSMAVGGMVGGGIFSVLGVVVSTAGQWAWLSFLISGLIALASAHSYSQLARKYGERGGAFSFLNKVNLNKFAGGLSWMLILGYLLTISVYAFTFGHYMAKAFSLGDWFPRISSLTIILILTFVNIRGVGESSRVEIITVWGKLLILAGLSVTGLLKWSPEKLSQGIDPTGLSGAFVGAAITFMAYEGFQLLTYDYDEIRNADRILPLSSLTAVLTVIVVYIIVALGAVMLVGADAIVAEKEVSLIAAGRQAMGITGVMLVTIAAVFSTASAINATLFSTARLMEDVSEKRYLPAILSHENLQKVPDYSVILLGTAGIVLSVIGSLGTLVEAASLTFLFTFCTVNLIAWHERIPFSWISLVGAAGSAVSCGVVAWRLWESAPYYLAGIGAMVFLAIVIQPVIRMKSHRKKR